MTAPERGVRSRDQHGPLLAVVDQAGSLADALGRDDLVDRLARTHERVSRPG